jgi:hypothetical protein
MDAYMIDSPDKEAHMDVALQFGRDFNNTHVLVYQTPGHTIYYYYADNNTDRAEYRVDGIIERLKDTKAVLIEIIEL